MNSQHNRGNGKQVNDQRQTSYSNRYTNSNSSYKRQDHIYTKGKPSYQAKPHNKFTLKKLIRIWKGKDRTDLFYEEDIEANRICSAAAASGLLFFVPITASPYSKYGRYWANQGVIMLVVMLASGIVSLAIGGILSLFGAIPYIGIVFRIIKLIFLIVLWMANLALLIRGCYYAAKGRAVDFPLIGYIRIISYR